MNFLFAVIFGLIEGITEWLPISSTGHMLLVDQFIKLKADADFKEMFFVVIQLGAIIAVIYMYWGKLWPFRIIRQELIEESRPRKKKRDSRWKNEIKIGSIGISRPILLIWAKVIVATLPAAVLGLLLDDWMDKYAHTPAVIAVALIVYGVLFILVEDRNKKRPPKITKLSQLTYLDALKMGLFQTLAIVPGTSRSGATIVGALTMGVSRKLAAEFSFFLAVPTMAGATLLDLLDLLKEDASWATPHNITMLILGCVVAFVVALLAMKWFVAFLTKYGFKAFGIYRIIVGGIIIVLLLTGHSLAMVD